MYLILRSPKPKLFLMVEQNRKIFQNVPRVRIAQWRLDPDWTSGRNNCNAINATTSCEMDGRFILRITIAKVCDLMFSGAPWARCYMFYSKTMLTTRGVTAVATSHFPSVERPVLTENAMKSVTQFLERGTSV